MSQADKRILMIYRPVDEFVRGTGIAAVCLYLQHKLEKNGFEVFVSKVILKIKPFHSFWSIIVYDWINPFLMVFHFCYKNVRQIFFVDVVSCLPIFIVKILYPGVRVTTLVHAYPEEKALYLSYVRFLTKIAIKFSDVIICTTDENRERLIEKYHIHRKEKLIVLPLGLTIQPDLSGLVFKKERKGELTIGYLGSSDQRKKLVRIASLMRHATQESLPLCVVTAGPISADYCKLFQSSTSDIVRYEHLGVISEDQKIDFFNRIDAFIFPTAREGFGLPILESFFFKKPCIIFRNSLIPKILRTRCVECEEPLNFDRVYDLIVNTKISEEIEANYLYALTFDWNCYVEYFNSNS